MQHTPEFMSAQNRKKKIVRKLRFWQRLGIIGGIVAALTTGGLVVAVNKKEPPPNPPSVTVVEDDHHDGVYVVDDVTGAARYVWHDEHGQIHVDPPVEVHDPERSPPVAPTDTIPGRVETDSPIILKAPL